MLEKTFFEIHPEVCKYSHSAYSQPSFLFFLRWFSYRILWRDPTRRFWVSSFTFRFHLGTDWQFSLTSKMNLWYLDDGNLSDDHIIVLKDLKKRVEAEKTLGLKIKLTKCEFFFLGDITEKRRSTILASFQKLCLGIKTPKKDELIILGSPLGPKSQADLLEKKINELENVNGIVEKLDAHYVFLCWKIASVCQGCCTFWEPVHVLKIQVSFKSMTKLHATCFPKCVMWISKIFRVLSSLCPLKWVVLGCHPHHY